ncbi:hypothetical protein MF134_23505, partial [Jiella sp. LLJ827]|nr:hypothetical protein [Jiella sp. LLJ827]
MSVFAGTIEKAAALCVGSAAVAHGSATTGVLEASIGAAALIGFILEKRRRFGPESERVRKRIQDEVFQSYQHLISGSDGDSEAAVELRAANEALSRSLEICLIDRKSMAAAAVTSEGFPGRAIALVMEGLGRAEPDFFGTKRADTIAYRFARDVVTAGIQAAVDNTDYYRHLEKDLMFEMARAIGTIESSVGELHEQGRRVETEIAAIREGQDTLPQRTADLVQQALQDAISSLGVGEGREALRAIAERFGHDNPDASIADLRAVLEKAAEDYGRLKAQITALSEKDDRVRNLTAAAQADIDAGRFDDADSLLAQAEALQQEHQTLEAIRKQAAVREARGTAALLSGEVDTAAEHFSKIVQFFAPFSAREAILAANENGERLQDHAERWGRSGLDQAISLFSQGVALCTEADMPSDWARTQNNLGNAYASLGARLGGEAGREALDAAVTAYKGALRVRTEADMPSDWAMTQSNLGSAYASLGDRLGGEAGREALDAAVTAYKGALRVRTEADMPSAWATTQSNLGSAYASLGDQLGGEAGREALDAAVTAYKGALRVHTEADMPSDWARTQSNLGNAYASLGDRLGGEAGREALDAAVTAYKGALRVRTEADMPSDWARTQSNLGSAYASLGDR